ncbi:MAG: isochorismatase family protein [Acidimicrobiales bacterium]
MKVQRDPGQEESLAQDYRKAGFGASLPFGRSPAILVIDVAQAYFTPGSPLYHERFTTILEPLSRFLIFAREQALPIIYTSVLYDSLDEAGLFGVKVPALAAFLRSSPLSDLHPELAPHRDEPVVVKYFASGFFGTDLANLLRARAIDTVLITGVSTSGCVRATALDAVQLGFAPFIITDLVSDRDPEVHASNLFDLGQKYAELVTASSVAALLSSGRDRP